MERRRVLFLSLTFTLIVGSICFFFSERSDKDKKYIFDRDDNITLKDVNESLKTVPPLKIQNQIKSVVSRKTEIKFNHTSLKYFKSLEKLFPESKDIDEHLEMIKKYLMVQFPPKDATILFETYKSYLNCEVEIAKNFDIKEINSSDPMEVIEALRRIQGIRREKMGEELADALFGAQVKSSEYAIRKSAIIEDSSLYGSEKEDALKNLNNDMWGDEEDSINKNRSPYNLYRDKLKMYKRDIGELDSEEKQSLIKNFRGEFFSTEAVAKLEAVEKKREEESNRESLYYKKEKLINDSNEFDDQTKKEKIAALQEEIFGSEAANFRARLNLRVN